MNRLLCAAAVVALFPSLLGAIGLAQGDSYTGLRAIHSPFHIVYSVDAATVKMVGGVKGFGADLSGVAFKRLKAGGVPVVEGTFNPLAAPFVSLDLWARGVTKPDAPKDPRRVFDFQFQVFAPIRDARHPKSGSLGRVEVWERSVYGVCPAEDAKGGSGAIQDQVRGFLKLCDLFSEDWRAARGLNSKRPQTHAAAPRPVSGAAHRGTPSAGLRPVRP